MPSPKTSWRLRRLAAFYADGELTAFYEGGELEFGNYCRSDADDGGKMSDFIEA